jgi:UDP:flavonoid glycosyltransferase YjiC (YdhE family)
MRTLFAALGSAGGHLLPLLPFAQALRAAGHAVTFALPTVADQPPLAQRLVRAAGFPAVPLPPREPNEAALRRLGIDPARLGATERDPHLLRSLFLGHHLEPQAEALIALARQEPLDLLVWGDGLFPAAVAAERLGVPHACVQVFVTGLIAYHARFALREPLAARLDQLRAAHGLRPDPDLSAPYRHLVLAQFPPSLLAPDQPALPTRVAIRPAPTATPDAAAVPAWLRSLPPRGAARRVYVTFGTLLRPEDGVPLLRAILDGLADEPVRVIVTVGPQTDPAALGEPPPNAHVEQYVPQEALLPACDLVVFHGGSGTLLGVIEHGLPMVVVPVRADQPENGEAAARAGAAVVLAPAEVTPARVRAAVRATLGGPGYRARARRLQAELRGLPAMEHAVRLLESLAAG